MSSNQSLQGSIDQVLKDQFVAAKHLTAILDQEASAIKNRDGLALSEISARKLDSLKALESLEQLRRRHSEASGEIDAGLPLWKQLVEVIKVCDRKNQLNGVMLRLRRESIQRAMDLIADRDNATITYAPDGSTQLGAGRFSTSVSV